jgi:hypothetical protein
MSQMRNEKNKNDGLHEQGHTLHDVALKSWTLNLYLFKINVLEK